MDVVDAQIHMGLEGPQPTLAQMDALGVAAVLVDEFWGQTRPEDFSYCEPGYLFPNGAWRSATPVTEQAALLHPERFASVVRVDRRDPDLAALLKVLRARPDVRALRILPVRSPEETAAFEDGAYDELFELAQELGFPIFAFVPGCVELLPPKLETFPRLSLVVDHCGMPFQGLPTGYPRSRPRPADPATYFGEVLELAAYPNAALKWSHAQARFAVPDYPYVALRPILRRAIEAFGPERIMWASDKSVVEPTWGEILFSIRDNPDLTEGEKAWILGRSLRNLLNWPAPTGASQPGAATPR